MIFESPSKAELPELSDLSSGCINGGIQDSEWIPEPFWNEYRRESNPATN
jgi:hypothetical protein